MGFYFPFEEKINAVGNGVKGIFKKYEVLIVIFKTALKFPITFSQYTFMSLWKLSFTVLCPSYCYGLRKKHLTSVHKNRLYNKTENTETHQKMVKKEKHSVRHQS